MGMLLESKNTVVPSSAPGGPGHLEIAGGPMIDYLGLSCSPEAGSNACCARSKRQSLQRINDLAGSQSRTLPLGQSPVCGRSRSRLSC